VTVDGKARQLDVVVATASDPTAPPAEREVIALGEAEADEAVGPRRLRALERARAALGTRAAGAKLVLFAPTFEPALTQESARRADVELVGLERLYRGA
jgi:hypothetical protein